jgi:NADH dehydrogenase
VLRRQKNTRVILGEVVGFDLAAKTVLLKDGERVPFDYLVLATGATDAYFGHDEWAEVAPGLKTIEDATEIRRRVLSAFERAERERDPAVRQRLLTFVIVGGGPTGVEMAGAISELATQTLKHDFRAFDPGSARIILVEGHERLLPPFHEKLSRKAKEALNRMGVLVMNSSVVTDVERDHVLVKTSGGTERIDTETVIWAAGVKASGLGKLIADAVGGVELDRAGRVMINPDCTVGGRSDVFVVGDMAHGKYADGRQLPGVAPVAMQQGEYVARLIARRLAGDASAAEPFRYWDKGMLATIGHAKAVAQTGGMRFSGFVAWLAWLFIHILYLARFENRVLVLWQWFFNWVTRNRAARLITGEAATRPADPRRDGKT